ncbi:hypothetical protein MUK42_21418 [Musa troglodytarum]|uniref:Uncharacterized protein n=1 Tax=Musa troglodytarum TaxID=320322 RepID=A0A9E7FQF8_9LILI|nr:hypothetical protein MUK42_21418 [Musa troglodytarum]
MAEEVVPRWGVEEEKVVVVVVGREAEAGWKCWKHPVQTSYGVCPGCLRDRLLRLCPDCANVRPCGCFPSPSSSASSSSLSSAELPESGAAVGAVGLLSILVDSEPTFGRSRSVGFPLPRSRSAAVPDAASVAGLPRARQGRKGRAPFLRAARREESSEAELYRSRSVAAERSEAPAGGREKEGKAKGGRWWHFPSPMRVFRHWKSATKVMQERLPFRRR